MFKKKIRPPEYRYVFIHDVNVILIDTVDRWSLGNRLNYVNSSVGSSIARRRFPEKKIPAPSGRGVTAPPRGRPADGPRLPPPDGRKGQPCAREANMSHAHTHTPSGRIPTPDVDQSTVAVLLYAYTGTRCTPRAAEDRAILISSEACQNATHNIIRRL